MAGLFGSLASGLRRRELKATDAGNLSWAALFGQQNSRVGVSVNVDSALKVSTVFGCPTSMIIWRYSISFVIACLMICKSAPLTGPFGARFWLSAENQTD